MSRPLSVRLVNERALWSYPRTLIVGKGFDQSSGVGITLTSLFRDWPKDGLAAVCAPSEAADTTVCEIYYALGSEEARWVWPISRFEQKVSSGPVLRRPADGGVRRPAASVDDRGRHRGRTYAGLARQTAWAALVASGGEHFLRHLGASARLAAWIRNFRPDVLYTHLESLPMIRFVDSLVAQFDLPLVIHMMDDWPLVPEHEGILSPLTRRVINRELRRLMDKASCNMAISQYMCEAFEARYGHAFLPFHNVLDTRAWIVAPRTSWLASKPFRVVYTGRVGKANETALRDVAAVVALLADKGLAINLEIYALGREPFSPGALPDSRAVRLLPAIDYADIPGLLVEADLLVLPLDFSQKALEYARYSMPTKVAEYLGSGTPILVYCPEDTAVGHYARNSGWGALVGTRDRDALARTIVRLASDEQERRRLGQIALSVAQADHDPSRVREDFARALSDASTAGSGR